MKITFASEFLQAARQSPQLFFAPLTGALQSVRHQLNKNRFENEDTRFMALSNGINATAVVNRANPPSSLLKEAKMLFRAKLAVLECAEWLTAAQLASIPGWGDRNPIVQLEEWKCEGAIFVLRIEGIDHVPGYALDPEQKYRPFEALARVIGHFGKGKDGWALAFWFQSANSFLGGKRPMDLLTTRPVDVIAAAADEAIGIVHA